MTLLKETTDGGSRTVWLSRSPDGGLSIQGQDLGGLPAFMGPGVREYEWATAVAAEQLPALCVALGGSSSSDVVELVKARFSGVRHGEFREFCEDHDIKMEFWSRFGE